MSDTLPERLVTARSSSMPHVDFLEMVLADEVARRDRTSAGVRAKAAHLDPTMVLEAWDDTAAITYDHSVWAELTTLRFVDENHNALILRGSAIDETTSTDLTYPSEPKETTAGPSYPDVLRLRNV